MHCVKSLIFSIVFMFSGLAQGQEVISEWADLPPETPIKPKMRLPDGMDYRVDKQDYKCYAVNEYKTLVLLSNEYQALYDWRVDHEVMLRTFKLMGDTYDTRIANFKEQVASLKGERSMFVKQLSADQQYILQLKTQETRASLGWKIVAGIEMVGLVALSITAAVK